MPDGAGEDVLGLGETVASIEQALDRIRRASIAREEVAVIRIERVARFLIRPAARGARIPDTGGRFVPTM